MTKPPRLRNRLIFAGVVGLLVFVAVVAWGDFRGVAEALRGFRWQLMPVVLGLVVFNYSLRFLKWQFYLDLVGVRGVSRTSSLLIFLVGLGMTITPGKIGEWIKSYFLSVRHGIPVSRSAPIVLGERLTDGFGLLILAAAGLLLVREGWLFVVVLAVLGIGFVALLQYRPFGAWAIARAAKLPVIRGYAGFMTDFYATMSLLLSPKALLVGTLLGAVSWAGEGLALYVVYLGLGAENTWQLAVQGLFVLAITTLAGLVSLLPGGLGVAEGGIAALSQSLVGLSRENAAAATLLIRLCTLWFGVGIGSVALVVAGSKQGGREGSG